MRHSRIKTTGFKILMLGLILGLLSSCIRPDKEITVTATPDLSVNVSNGGTSTGPTLTPPTIATSPAQGGLPASIQATDLPSIEAFILSQGHQVSSGSLNVWQSLSLGDDLIVGFSYTNPSSLPCIGLVIADRTGSGTLNVYNGDSTCATELGTPAIAGNWFLVTNNQPNEIYLTATVGEIFNPTSLVNSVGIIYSDGQATPVDNVQNNRFLAARTDSPASALRVIFNNEFGNIEAEVFLNP